MARRYKTAQDILNMSDPQLKRLYSWRSYEARKKLQRLEQKYGPESQIVRDHRERFKPLKERGDLSHRQLAQAIALTYDFGRSKTGQTYENLADRLHDTYGFKTITSENLEASLEFLDDARARGIAALYPSQGAVLAAASRAVNQGLSLEEWRANVDDWIKRGKERAEKGKDPVKPRLQKKYRTGSSDAYNKRK